VPRRTSSRFRDSHNLLCAAIDAMFSRQFSVKRDFLAFNLQLFVTTKLKKKLSCRCVTSPCFDVACFCRCCSCELAALTTLPSDVTTTTVTATSSEATTTEVATVTTTVSISSEITTKGRKRLPFSWVIM